MAKVRKEVLMMRESVQKVVALLARTSVRVSMSGSRAYVENDEMGRPVRVNIPALPDDASDLAIMAVRGFIDHEVAHILFTNFKVRNTCPKKLEAYWNTVEDIYIERKMGAALEGSKSNLSKVRIHLLKTVFDKAYTDVISRDIKGTELFNSVLAVPVMRALCGQTEFSDWMEDKWEAVSIIRDRIEDARIPRMINAAQNTGDCIDIARILASLVADEKKKEEERENPPKAETPPPSDKEPEPEEPDADEDSPDFDSGESEPDESEPEDADCEDDEGGSDSRDEDSEESEDDSGSSTGDELGSDESESDKAEEDEDEGGSEEDEEEGGSGEESESEVGKESDEELDEGEADKDITAGKDESDADGSDEGFDFDLLDDDELGDTGEPMSIEDAMEAALEDAVPEDESSYCAITDEFDFYDVPEKFASHIRQIGGHEALRKDYFPSHDSEAIARHFEGILEKGQATFSYRIGDKIGGVTKNLAKQLERVIVSQNKSQWLAGQKKGRIHGGSLFKLKTGDTRVFRQKEEHRSKEAAVQIVIDLSGSMTNGDRIGVALRSAYVLSDALDRCGIPSRVVGFTTVFEVNQYSYERYLSEKGIKFGSISNHRLEPLNLPIIKDWGDKANTSRVQKRFGFIANERFHLANNADGECILRFVPSLMQRKEKLKMMIVLSDGAPCAQGYGMNEHMKGVAKFIEDKTDIELLGVGIQTTSVKRFYKNSVVVNDLSDLAPVVCGQIRKMIA